MEITSVLRIQYIISRDREHGTPLYFIDTCFADVQFHENMIRISRLGIHFSGIETSASGWDQKFVPPEFAWFETFSKDSIPLALYRLFRLPYRRGRKFKNVEADRWEMQR